ncbi:MAG: hypothetical protein IKI24_03255 [Clostridia bacterium]|jgi:hypothetical protein|nr:hypothetical protein [Clostridia bacterium]MCR4578263.1 hypothetical protein [Clostridiales bacterium]
MNDGKTVYSQAFHGFLIYFFLWACAAMAILFGIRYIYFGQMNGYDGFPLAMLIAVNGLMIALGLFTVKARFDLAAYRAKAPVELVGACAAGAMLCLANYWVEGIAGDDYERSLIGTAFILACWAVGLYRYYRRFGEKFVN